MKYIFRCYYCLDEIVPNNESIFCTKCLRHHSVRIKSYLGDYVFYYNIFDNKFYLKSINNNKATILLKTNNTLTFKQLISFIENLIFI
jgi:hypothetical protein